MSTEVISVPEISCAACKTAIEGALNPLVGVRNAVVDVPTRVVVVEFDEAAIGRAALVAAIEDLGFAVAAGG